MKSKEHNKDKNEQKQGNTTTAKKEQHNNKSKNARTNETFANKKVYQDDR